MDTNPFLDSESNDGMEDQVFQGGVQDLSPPEEVNDIPFSGPILSKVKTIEFQRHYPG